MSRNDLAAELDAIETMALPQLRSSWSRLLKSSPPKVGAGLLRLALAHKLQSRAKGGVSKANERKLRELAADRKPTDQRAGTRLVRSWKGTAHVVTITDDLRFQWNGKEWNSLSEVARAITGTRWSGPAFFGLTTAKRAA